MGIKQWAAGIIRKTPVTPAGPYQDSAASGIWTLDQVVYWLKQNLWPVAGNTNPSAFVENLFSTYLYTGTGAAQTITNGIDLAGKGGLVWLKGRSAGGVAWGYGDHEIFDTVNTGSSRRYLRPDGTNATAINGSISSIPFNANGFNLADGTQVNNRAGDTIVSWTFRKQPKFFDVVTYTGNGTTQTISHNLGATPGCIIVKCTSTGGNWRVFHRSYAAGYGTLNVTNAFTAAGAPFVFGDNTNVVAPTSTQFTIGSDPNDSGQTYVAYLFAHNAGGFGLSGTENVISCGSFTTDGSVNASVNLGWEPQWLIIKNTTSADNWWIVDNMRGYTANDSGNTNPLVADTPNAELSNYPRTKPTSTGFVVPGTGLEPNKTYIYIAIRRGPMQVPTDGTKVFNPAFYGTNGVTGYLGSPADMNIQTHRNISYAFNPVTRCRLVGGGNRLTTSNTDTEVADTTNFWSNMTGMNPQGETTTLDSTVIDWTFRRAPGFFDVVCYTGTGSATTVTHNLGVAPELMIVKMRAPDGGYSWNVYHKDVGNTAYLVVDGAYGTQTSPSTYWNSTTPTTTSFSVGIYSQVNQAAATYVAYLFATCPGVSKVGSYTGNGSSQTLNCGFTAGARFVLIKRTDSTGDWYVWDSARGIVAGNDPHLSMNTTATEVTTDDSVDADSTGFIVNQLSATNVNVTSATYIYLAIA